MGQFTTHQHKTHWQNLLFFIFNFMICGVVKSLINMVLLTRMCALPDVVRVCVIDLKRVKHAVFVLLSRCLINMKLIIAECMVILLLDLVSSAKTITLTLLMIHKWSKALDFTKHSFSALSMVLMLSAQFLNTSVYAFFRFDLMIFKSFTQFLISSFLISVSTDDSFSSSQLTPLAHAMS